MPKTLPKPTASGAPEGATAGSRPASTEPHHPPRRDFLGLPLAQRREILKAQAANARVYYAQSSEWREWEAADLTGQLND